MGDGVRAGRIAARLGLVVLLVVGGFLLQQLVRKADHAHASRRAAPAAEAGAPPDAAAWRQTLRLDRGAPPAGLLVSGWSAPEPGSGVWSSGPVAALRLPPTPVRDKAKVALLVEAFVAPTRPFQQVRVRAGTRTLGEWRLTSSAITPLEFSAPAELLGPAGELDLQIDLPDADSPSRHVKDSTDPRRLAIKLHRVEATG